MLPIELHHCLLALNQARDDRKAAERAFQRIQDYYQPRMIHTLTQGGVPYDQAHDISLDVLLILWQHPHRFDAARAQDGRVDRLLTGWLETILARRRADYFQMQSRRPQLRQSENWSDAADQRHLSQLDSADDPIHRRETIKAAVRMIRDFRQTRTRWEHQVIIDLMLDGGLKFPLEYLMQACELSRPTACRMREAVRADFEQFVHRTARSSD